MYFTPFVYVTVFSLRFIRQYMYLFPVTWQQLDGMSLAPFAKLGNVTNRRGLQMKMQNTNRLLNI